MLLLLLACAPEDSGKPADTDTGTETSTVPDTDLDGDGVAAPEDCDDGDSGVYPGAPETCDGRDEDCDTDVDEDATDASDWFADEDEDGVGGALVETSCEAPEGAVAVSGDCDDADAAVHPGAAETCDGVDNDCDASTGEAGVSVDGVEGFTSVQAAIDAAGEGSVVAVCGGTWEEALVVPRSLSLVGSNGATVDAAGAGPVVWVTGGSVTLQGLTLQGGVGVDTGAGRQGGGVHAEAADGLTLVDCEVSDNQAVDGGGILGPALGVLELQGGRVADNEADVTGGAIRATSLIIEGTTLEGNTAEDGGALYLPDGSAAVLTDVVFQGNEAYTVGGAIYLAPGGEMSTTRVTWDGNRAAVYAAGLYADEGSVITDVDGLFDNNAADDKGGAMYLRYATYTGSGTRFIGCVGSWGGAAMLYTSTLTLDAATVEYNSADLGGGFYVYIDSVLTLTDSFVEGNTASSGGGARLRTTSTLISDNTGWGLDGADNTPEDIDVDYVTFSFGDAASFTCSNSSGVCE